jgi:hypothetical protein
MVHLLCCTICDQRSGTKPWQVQGNDLLIGSDGFLPTFAHATPPLKQQAWGDAIKPGNGWDRHAGLHSLFDQPDLFLGSIAPTAMDAGDDFNTLNGLRYRRMPRLKPRSSGLRQVSGRIRGWSRLVSAAVNRAS